MTEEFGEWGRRYSFSPDAVDMNARQQWAGDREQFLVFLADITQQSVYRALEEVRAVLSRNKCVAVVPSEYYHITVKQVGCIREPPERSTDITHTTANKLQRQARNVFAEFEPFEVQLSQLNHFDRVIFSEVRDPGSLSHIHQQLSDLPEMPQWNYEREEYVPHMTLSHFRSKEGIDSLFEELDLIRDVDIPPVTIDSLELVEVPPAMLYPSFEEIQKFDL